jgi:hypothetical protein
LGVDFGLHPVLVGIGALVVALGRLIDSEQTGTADREKLRGPQERGNTIIVLSSAVDSMNLGGTAGLTSLARAGTADCSERGPESPAHPSYWLPIRRAASAVITRESPRKSMLTPTRRPIAQLAELGQPCQIR